MQERRWKKHGLVNINSCIGKCNHSAMRQMFWWLKITLPPHDVNRSVCFFSSVNTLLASIAQRIINIIPLPSSNYIQHFVVKCTMLIWLVGLMLMLPNVLDLSTVYRTALTMHTIFYSGCGCKAEGALAQSALQYPLMQFNAHHIHTHCNAEWPKRTGNEIFKLKASSHFAKRTSALSSTYIFQHCIH